MTVTVDDGSSLSTPQRNTVGEESAMSEAAQQKMTDEDRTAPVGVAEREQPDSDPACLRAQIRALRADLAATTVQRDQLAASLTLAHTVIERMADAAYWAQADGRLIYVNEAACRELGYKREELLALSVIDVMPGHTADMWAEHWAELGRVGALRINGTHRRKDGSLFPVEVSTSLIQAGSTRYACGIVRNMSVRVEAERALADSEAKFAAAFDLSPIAMSLTRLDTGEFIEVNGAFVTVTGFSRGEAIGRTPLDINLYATPDARAALLADLRQTGALVNRPTVVRVKSGELRKCLVSARILDVGRHALLLASIVDITEQSQMYETLRESEERFRLAFENANDGVCLVGQDGRLLRVNARMADMFGYSTAELETMTVQDLTHPDSMDTSPTFIRQAVSGRSTHGVFDKRYIHRDGRDVWGRVSSSLVRNAAGEPVYFISHVQDITEWRRAVIDLADREARLHAIYNFAGVAITVTDTAGRVLDCNPYLLDMLGYSQAELQGLLASSITHPDDVAESQRHIEELVAGRMDSYRIEKRYIRSDGQIIWADLSVSPLRDDQGIPFALVGVWINITARKEAEAALRESEDRYRLVMQGSGAGIWDWDIARQRIYYSPQWKHMRGYEDHEIGNSDREWSDRIYPDDRAMVDAALSAYFAEAARTPETPPRFSLDYRTLHKDGSSLWIHDEGVVQLAEDGTPVRMVGTEVDITERKRAEEALRRSEGRLRAIFEASQAGILVSSLTGNIEFANQAAADLFGTPLAQLTGANYLTYVHPSEKETAAQFMSRFAAGNLDSLETERHFCRTDGADFWGLLSTRPLYDEAGNPSALLGIITDVTEYKRLVASLRAIADDLYKAQSVARLGSWTWHVPENRLEWSDALYTIFGLDRATVAGNLFDLAEQAVHPNDRAAFGASFRTLIEQGHAEPLEYRIIRHNQNVRTVWSEASELVLDEHGRLVRVTGIVQDITERKEAEQERERLLMQLQQAHKMETIGRLAGGIAHDFNNLLAVILMRLEMAMAMTEADAPIRRHLGESLRAAERSAELTRQLLGFARRQPVTPRVLDLNASVADMLDMLRQLIGEEIRLTWQPGPDLWPVKLDPAQLSQILANLCVNARDAIDGAGAILIATQNVFLDVASPGPSGGDLAVPHVLLTISDDGSGIDHDLLERIFEPFVTTKGVGKGTGLGLATVYGIVQQNGGDIRVNSQMGIGTTFRIYLPCYIGAEAHATSEAPKETPRGDGETILLVEDEAAVMQMMQESLAQLGYVVLTASRPGEALELVQSYPTSIDLLVTDVIMPEMNGRLLAEKIRLQRPAINVLYISGYPADLIAHRGVLSADSDLLSKPFARQTLADRVRKALDRPQADKSSSGD